MHLKITVNNPIPLWHLSHVFLLQPFTIPARQNSHTDIPLVCYPEASSSWCSAHRQGVGAAALRGCLFPRDRTDREGSSCSFPTCAHNAILLHCDGRTPFSLSPLSPSADGQNLNTINLHLLNKYLLNAS